MKFKILFPVTMLMSLIFGLEGGDIPNDVTKCKASDNECIRMKIMEILTKYPNGNPEFGMMNVSALTFENVTISRATASTPIQLNFKFNKIVVSGVEKTNVTRVSGLDKNLKHVEVDAIIPVLKISGDYATKGKILLLALDGYGQGDLEMYDAQVKVRVKCNLEQRNGKHYVKISKLKSDLEPKNMNIKLENLVNGNKELSEVINTVINDNWRDIWNELRDGINGVLDLLLMQLIENILKVLPYDNFYLESN